MKQQRIKVTNHIIQFDRQSFGGRYQAAHIKAISGCRVSCVHAVIEVIQASNGIELRLTPLGDVGSPRGQTPPLFWNNVKPSLNQSNIVVTVRLVLSCVNIYDFAERKCFGAMLTLSALAISFSASQGRICRKSGKSKKAFSRKEAEATFKSLVKTHEKYGWVSPPVSDG